MAVDLQRGGPQPGTVLRAIRLMLWSIVHFVFYFMQQVAELLAPLLLVLGLGWWALPRLVDAITTHEATADQQARDILNSISGTIPHTLVLAGHSLTPTGLIFDGLLLMALAALGATISAVAARGM
ncbi:hypothetical protein [Lichenicoccus roseus]|uniref:AI-2E family transporter n=1 Tax=Lichenicoccus roseus TaxID=2683649 RepID=A0A5R9J9H4_9PROT|nr:hypothetical protein [Lichenicoccus roseus]TLU73463.1 hypothetical protein FE263_08735 [Lichenicoccus roseus]